MNNRRRNQFIAGLICLFASAVFVIHFFTKQKVKDASALSTISGQLNSYSFRDGFRGRHHYIIRLSGHPAAFQIPADFLEAFAKDRFQSDVKRNDSVSVSISRESEKNLASDRSLFVFSVRSRSATYLDEQDSIRIYNSAFPILASILFLLAGVAMIYFRPKLVSEYSSHA
jgi:hypothetical protein